MLSEFLKVDVKCELQSVLFFLCVSTVVCLRPGGRLIISGFMSGSGGTRGRHRNDEVKFISLRK